jgi:hypothetical protein
VTSGSKAARWLSGVKSVIITERAAPVPGQIHGNAALVVGEDRDNVAP